MHSGYQKAPPEVHRQPWLDMVGRVPMSACAGQRLSGEASGWVRWSSSRTDWNHGHGCSDGVGTNQPKQQGSTVQLMDIISSPVPLSACGILVRCGSPQSCALSPSSADAVAVVMNRRHLQAPAALEHHPAQAGPRHAAEACLSCMAGAAHAHRHDLCAGAQPNRRRGRC